MINLFLMADEMGLGKTVQVVCFLNHIIKERFTVFPALVLAPKSILLQWEKVCTSLCDLVILYHESWRNRLLCYMADFGS
jgi:chromodomain-helicase-DNA-binding protein 4